MFGEYGVGHKGKIQFSSDCGVTWRTILTMDPSDPTVDHVHDVRFDPYEKPDLECWGDGRPADTVFFTDDFGATWQTLADKHYIRATTIIPLPDCVLFRDRPVLHRRDVSARPAAWRYVTVRCPSVFRLAGEKRYV